MKNIFITGASGCIGHYIVESLLKDTEDFLYLLVRNPHRLQFEWQNNPRIKVLQGNLQEIAVYKDLLQTKINVAILAATSWGGAAESYDINVVKTLALMKMLNPEICEQILYFSTASILDRNNNLLQPAEELGTDYIRTKYQCFSQLNTLKVSDRIITLFPTLVFGGDRNKPVSHLSSGLPEIVKWLDLVRWVKTDGSFHFIHGRDIAQVVTYLVQHPQLNKQNNVNFGDNYQTNSLVKIVLGNKSHTVNETIKKFCNYFGKKVYFAVPLYNWLTNLLIKIFRIQMDSWSYFSLNYRHFTYKNTVTPQSFGLTNYVSTIEDIMKTSGF